MARHRDTGEGDPYSDEEEAAVADALEAALYDEESEGLPSAPGGGRIDVEAQVEWAGTVDRNGRDGVRRTRLDGVELAAVRAAAADLRQARRAGPAEPYRSYQAKGWRAQLRQMNRTGRGREAVESAGLSRETMRRWQSGRRQPSASSRARIAAAYETVRNPRAAAVKSAQHNLADVFTGAVRARYGVNVRLRNIVDMRIDD